MVYGAPNAFVGRYPRGPVVRIQGIDAGFGQPSYAPAQWARLQIATDETEYFCQITRLVVQSGLFAVNSNPKSASPATKFERRFRERGVAIHRLELRKVSPVT